MCDVTTHNVTVTSFCRVRSSQIITFSGSVQQVCLMHVSMHAQKRCKSSIAAFYFILLHGVCTML